MPVFFWCQCDPNFITNFRVHQLSQLFSPATRCHHGSHQATPQRGAFRPFGPCNFGKKSWQGSRPMWNDSHVGICSPSCGFLVQVVTTTWTKCQEHVRSSLCRSGALSLSEILCGMLLYLPLDSVSKHPRIVKTFRRNQLTGADFEITGAMSNWSWEHVSGSWLSFPSGREPRSGARVWWCWRPLVLWEGSSSVSLWLVRYTYMMHLFRENLLDRNIVTLLPWQLNPQQMCFSCMCTLGESKRWRFAYLLWSW